MAKKKQNPPQSKSYTKSGDIQAGKAKPVGKRYTDKLAKKLGKSPNAEPTQKDINKYLGKGVYDEKRKDKSDISLRNKFELGGVYEMGSGEVGNTTALMFFVNDNDDVEVQTAQVKGVGDALRSGKYHEGKYQFKGYKFLPELTLRGKGIGSRSPYFDDVFGGKKLKKVLELRKKFIDDPDMITSYDGDDFDEYRTGGKVKQNPPQSKSYTKKNDIKVGKAKPVGKRYTDKLAKKLGKSPNAEPTQKDVNKYLGKGVYDEKRKDKSDISLRKRYEDGGAVEISIEEMKSSLGREPRYPSDFINGKKYVKCFLRPYYRLED
jgi:hypothetical protein